MIVFYISGHGFGHACRAIEVVNALLAARGDLRIAVRTTAAPWLFGLTVRGPVQLHPVECDTGVWQIDCLRLDESSTLEKARTFYREFDARIERERRFLEGVGASVVVGDIPPLAFAAAAAAGVPSIAIGNFTWDWIYADYIAREIPRGLDDFLRTIEAAYARADLVLRLPMWGGFEAFRAPIAEIPFIARRSRRDRAEIRAALGLTGDRPVVLVSFGGYELQGLDLGALARLAHYQIVMTGMRPPAFDFATRSALRWIDEQGLYRDGLRYEDLVRASDVVVTKPGYGIIAECVANGAAVVYTSRGRFREYDVLVEAMPRLLRCQFIERADLLAGRWKQALRAVLARPVPPDTPPTHGAEVAAERILRVVDQHKP